jgi:hypothetical protein
MERVDFEKGRNNIVFKPQGTLQTHCRVSHRGFLFSALPMWEVDVGIYHKNYKLASTDSQEV